MVTDKEGREGGRSTRLRRDNKILCKMLERHSFRVVGKGGGRTPRRTNTSPLLCQRDSLPGLSPWVCEGNGPLLRSSLGQ